MIILESIWDTLKNNLPAFKEHIANVLECEKSEDNVDKRK
jgi:uncharacterized protein with HEPN domain